MKSCMNGVNRPNTCSTSWRFCGRSGPSGWTKWSTRLTKWTWRASDARSSAESRSCTRFPGRVNASWPATSPGLTPRCWPGTSAVVMLDRMSDVTGILSAIEQGDPSAAAQLLPLVYDALHRLAAQRLAQEKPGQTLQATALVHEAYLRLVDTEKAQHWTS